MWNRVSRLWLFVTFHPFHHPFLIDPEYNKGKKLCPFFNLYTVWSSEIECERRNQIVDNWIGPIKIFCHSSKILMVEKYFLYPKLTMNYQSCHHFLPNHNSLNFTCSLVWKPDLYIARSLCAFRAAEHSDFIIMVIHNFGCSITYRCFYPVIDCVTSKVWIWL